MFGRRQSAVQQLIESAQLDSPVDIPSLLRGSYDDELDLDDSVDTGSELLTPSSLGEGSEDGAKKRAARRHTESELDALRSENGALRRAALASESKRTTEVGAYQAAMEASQQRTREQLVALREAQQAMHAELPALREKLAHSKAQFSQLAPLSTERCAGVPKGPGSGSMSQASHGSVNPPHLLGAAPTAREESPPPAAWRPERGRPMACAPTPAQSRQRQGRRDMYGLRPDLQAHEEERRPAEPRRLQT